jgi:hypothetical protein
MRTSRRDPEDRSRADAQSSKILEMLVTAGARGCTNSQLWAVCHAVNSRISDLRKRGHKITAKSEGGRIWRHKLIPPETFHPSAWQDRPRPTKLPLFDLPSGGVRV